MVKRIALIFLMFLVLTGISCVKEKSLQGNLIGVVTRETSGEIVANPVLVVAPLNVEADVVTQTITGDDQGRFSTTLLRGTYTVKIATKASGPFFAWPKEVTVGQSKTTIIALTIPKDFD
jgi:hypothetical protein